MTKLIQTLSEMSVVSQLSAWQDRHYISLASARGSRANADRQKIWIKGDVLTIESAKGYHSDAFLEDREAVEAAVIASGGSIRRI